MGKQDEKARRKRLLEEWQSKQPPPPPPLLSDEQLDELLDYVDERVVAQGCDNTGRFTDEWIRQNGLDRESVREWLASRGGYCDCEVVLNLEPEE